MSKFDNVKNICWHFTRNIAYHQAGIGKNKPIFSSKFWDLANGNFAEISVLEFCKLFGNPKDKNFWSKVVENTQEFRRNIEVEIQLDFPAFEVYVAAVKRYRDKYLSHFDTEVTLPPLDIATKVVFLYYNYVVSKDGAGKFPPNMQNFYIECFKEAEAIYQKNS